MREDTWIGICICSFICLVFNWAIAGFDYISFGHIAEGTLRGTYWFGIPSLISFVVSLIGWGVSE